MEDLFKKYSVHGCTKCTWVGPDEEKRNIAPRDTPPVLSCPKCGNISFYIPASSIMTVDPGSPLITPPDNDFVPEQSPGTVRIKNDSSSWETLSKLNILLKHEFGLGIDLVCGQDGWTEWEVVKWDDNEYRPHDTPEAVRN